MLRTPSARLSAEPLEDRTAPASAGDLDSTFGYGGIYSHYEYTNDRGNAVAVLPDGRMLIAGQSVLAGGVAREAIVTRLLPDGVVDETFGTQGRLSLDVFPDETGRASVVAVGLAVQADGKIVLGLDTHAGARSARAVRLNADGSLDPTFGTNGRVSVPGLSQTIAVALRPDGRILLAGRADLTGVRFGAVQLNADGSVDTAYGTNGVAGVDLPTAAFGSPTGAELYPDGRLVIGGYVYGGTGPSELGVVRLTAGGIADTTFDGDGVARIDFNGPEYGGAVAVQPDGAIVVAGAATVDGPSAPWDRTVARLKSDGSPDPTFGTGGQVRLPLSTAYGGIPYASDVTVQPDGKLVVTGDGGVMRLTAAGAADATFGISGALSDAALRGNYHAAVALPGGGLLLAGGTDPYYGTLSATRLTTSGAADATFGYGGLATVAFGVSIQVAASALEPGGSVVFVGSVRHAYSTTTYAYVTRATADGFPTYPFGYAASYVSWDIYGEKASAVAVQPDGKIVVAGRVNQPDGGAAVSVYRFSTDGLLDSTFGSYGSKRVDFPGDGDAAYGVAIQPDGKIVLVGSAGSGAASLVAAARLLPDGSLDASFGTDGKFTGFDGRLARGVAVRPDGRLVLAGGTADRAAAEAYQLTAAGAADGTFGVAGVAAVPFPGAFPLVTGIAIQADGRVVVGGSGVVLHGGVANSDMVAAQLNADGTPDTGFGSNGGVAIDFGGGSNEGASALALQPNGKILLADDAAKLVRLSPNGLLDGTFGTGGRAVVAPYASGGIDSLTSGLVVQSDGRIVLAGTSSWSQTTGGATVYFESATVARVFGGTPPLTLTGTTVPEFRPAGTLVGTLSGPTPGAYTFALADGAGGWDNEAFTVTGNELRTSRPLLTRPYSVRVRATPASGSAIDQAFDVFASDDPTVRLDGRTLTVTGTAAADAYSFAAGATDHALVLNGVFLAVRAVDVDRVSFDGAGGADAAYLTARGTGNALSIWPGAALLVGAGYSASALSETVTGYGGPTDGAYLIDTPGNDVFASGAGFAVLNGTGYWSAAVGFGGATAYASTGSDAAYFGDSAGDDVFSATPTYAFLAGAGFWNTAVGFDGVTGYASGGTDAAYLTGSAGDDVFSGTPTYSFLAGGGFWNTAVGFDGATAFGGGGRDAAYLTDSAGDDAFAGAAGWATLTGPGYFVGMDGFAGLNVYGTNGGTNRRTVGGVGYDLGFIGPWVG